MSGTKKTDYVKCAFSKCCHETKDILRTEAVFDGKKYYHPDCLKTKEDIAKIIDLFATQVNPNVVFAQLRRVVNNIIFDRGIESGLLLYGIQWYIDHRRNLTYPQGLYYVVQNADVQKSYAKRKSIAMPKKVVELRDDDNNVEFSFQQQQNTLASMLG